MNHYPNANLLEYEIKSPDYDLLDRKFTDMGEKNAKSLRYTFRKGEWYERNTLPFFGKSEADLMFVGDITCFEKQFEEARSGDTYDFTYQLAQLKQIFEKANLVVGNLETMIVPFAPYRTEKYVAEQNFHCNAPIEFLDAVKKCGIDMVTNANNHDMDTGAQGIGETIDNIERMGLIHTGTFKSDISRYELINIGKIKIAIIAFATEHNNKRSNLTPEGVKFLLNDYSKENAEKLISEARSRGANLVFTCIHWGKEHKLVQNSTQEEIAKELAMLGYDCIIGSHPHVLQPFDYVEANGKLVPVFYSMGNFLSHNVVGPKSQSIIACIHITKKNDEYSLSCSYIPIYTSRNFDGKKFVVLPIAKKPLDLHNIKVKKSITDVVGAKIDVSDLDFKELTQITEIALPKVSMPAPNPAKAKKFPIIYDDGKFVNEIHKEKVRITALSGSATQSSYSISATYKGIPITEIAEGAFLNNAVMKKLNFGSNITEIPANTCKGCINLEGFQLSRKTVTIKESAFENCCKLSGAVIRFNVKRIESRAFANCANLRSVKIPPNVKFIADDAFENCPIAVFYCEENSYAQKYAKEHGYKVVTMELKD